MSPEISDSSSISSSRSDAMFVITLGTLLSPAGSFQSAETNHNKQCAVHHGK